MSWFRWLRPASAHERLAAYNLRPDVLNAAAAMASDQRSDIYVARLQSSLTDSETVLRMMDRHQESLRHGPRHHRPRQPHRRPDPRYAGGNARR
jgi:hypothetical protein